MWSKDWDEEQTVGRGTGERERESREGRKKRRELYI